MVENTLVVGTVSAKPSTQCGWTDVKGVSDFFRAQSQQIATEQEIRDIQRGPR
jgi:hypothetical protein